MDRPEWINRGGSIGIDYTKALVAAVQHGGGLDTCRHVRDGHGAGEEEGASALTQPFHDYGAACHQPADDAEGFAHGADLHVHAAV
jgi:hypothetical protein